ncbi:unnamed protein product [Ixodes hexagonus]
MDDSQLQDICRVCRSEGAPDKPLFHPCICTGSIKYIHQDCLVQWLKYSRKEYCELCNHRFSFMPIYSPDMPKRLPIRDIVSGLLSSLGTAIRYWLHYTVVAFAWLGIVPLTACRIYRCLFTGSVSSLLTLPLDMLSTENVLSDSLYGCCIVTCTLCAFISLVWLREQVIHGEGPDWLEQEPQSSPRSRPLGGNAHRGVEKMQKKKKESEREREREREGAEEIQGGPCKQPESAVISNAAEFIHRRTPINTRPHENRKEGRRRKETVPHGARQTYPIPTQTEPPPGNTTGPGEAAAGGEHGLHDVNGVPGALGPAPHAEDIPAAGEANDGNNAAQGVHLQFLSGRELLDQFPPQDDINWNPIEWDRAAEELTWERASRLLFSLNAFYLT